MLILLQVVLPLALILLNWVVPAWSTAGLVLRTGALGLLLGYVALAGVWLFPPWWTPRALGLALLATAMTKRRGRREPPRARRMETAGALAAIAGLAVLVWPAIAGRQATDVAIDLSMPLGTGRYLVVSGGADGAINGHFATLTGPAAAGFIGQSYAVDIIGIGALGFYADGVAPADPQAYGIFGAPVLAPCAGTVALAEDGHPDMQVPQTDRDHVAGNHVMLDCGGDLFVLLAHMAAGSVKVAAGMQVATGDEIGAVGNSGNSAAPHLHIHVQRGLPADRPFAGTPRFFTVDGRFLVRGDRLVVRS
jgi:hypothetical protein